MGSKSKTWKYHQEQYESLFGVSRRQLKRWEKNGILDRNSLRSVVSLYIKRNVKRLDILKEFWEGMK